MKDLYIVGAGGMGREVLLLVQRINDVIPMWNIIGFIDDNSDLWGSRQDECLVLGGYDYLKELKDELWTVVAVGCAKVRRSIIEQLEKMEHVHFATLIDPSVIMSKRIHVGKGSIICLGTTMTVDITVGNHVIINPNSTVGHDVVIGDCVMIYPGVNISGNVNVGEEVELGTGSQIIQGRKIGKKSIIGAGAVVIRDIPEACTAVGIPAKPIKFI
jgi:sugar O-acyltransferase, sialic acid O-acetyltransferase NeuD family